MSSRKNSTSRRACIEADLVDCMIALPGQHFYSTQIHICLWFLAKNKNADAKRVRREFTGADPDKIISTYHSWLGDKGAGKYEYVAGFGKSATAGEIAAHGHVLTLGRCVGAGQVEDDSDPCEEKMPDLVAELHAQFAESAIIKRLSKKRNFPSNLGVATHSEAA